MPGSPIPPQPPVAPKRKLGTWAIVGIVVGAVVLLCCGVSAIGAIVGGGSEPNPAPSASKQAAVAPAVAATTASAAPTTAAPSAAPTTSEPAPPPAPTTVTMPNLVGMNAAVAEEKLKQLGITNVRFGSQDELDTWVVLPENWTVTKQSAKKGSKVDVDELIVLTCTKQR